MKILKATLENLAEQLAAANGGRITPNHLAPYLPVSLSMIQEHLDEMVDDCVVFCSEDNGLRTYQFPELLDAPPRPFNPHQCLYCSAESAEDDTRCLCFSCMDDLGNELLQLAGTTAWPAEGVWEHELLYITSSAGGPIRIADVAGRSRMTLKQVKAHLADLAARGFARVVSPAENGLATYEFPPIVYLRDVFRGHDRFIRLHPSSLKDELEVRIIRTLLALLALLAGCFLLVFAFPLRISVWLFLVAAPVVAFTTFRRKTTVEPEQIAGE